MRCSRCDDSGLKVGRHISLVCSCPAGKRIEQFSQRLKAEADASEFSRTHRHLSESAIHGVDTSRMQDVPPATRPGTEAWGHDG